MVATTNQNLSAGNYFEPPKVITRQKTFKWKSASKTVCKRNYLTQFLSTGAHEHKESGAQISCSPKRVFEVLDNKVKSL